MIYIVVGLLFQLFAGLIFALPHVSPGITERIEKSWRTGRGKLWSVVIIWSVICFILVILLWVSNYAEAIHNVDIFLNALVGSIASLAGYLAFVIALANDLYKDAPKWIKDDKRFSDIIKYEKLLSANRRILIVSIIGVLLFILLILVSYFSNVMDILLNLRGNYIGFILVYCFIFFIVFFILSLSFFILVKINNMINKLFKKPLWAYIIFIFSIGCILQILGALVVR